MLPTSIDHCRSAAVARDHWPANGSERGPATSTRCCARAQRRTRETLQVAGITARTTYADEIYEATPGEILAQIALSSGDVRRLLVIGHAPGIPATIAALAADDSDPAALRAVRTKFPTAAIAVLEFAGAWADLAAVGARLTTFEVPR